MTYGIKSGNDVKADKIRNLGREGLSFELQHQGNAIPVRLRVPGPQNVFNALAASAIALCLGESAEHIVEGLNGFEGIDGRFMLRPIPGGATLVDDTYNSNPSSLRAAIDSLKDLTVEGGRVIAGLGEMMELGDETVSAHLEAGGMMGELDACYFVAMGEHAQEMRKGAISTCLRPERALVVGTRREMTQRRKDVMRNGDLIFLKGSRKAGLEKVAESLKSKLSEEV